MITFTFHRRRFLPPYLQKNTRKWCYMFRA